MRRTAVLGLASWLVLGTALARSDAHADTLSGTKYPTMIERAHDIELRIGRGHATLVVKRTFENPSPKHDQAVLDIVDLPTGAVATGLRTLGFQKGQPIWYAGELLEAEAAAARYRELTGIGGYYPKDPALLSWRTADHLRLQVFPIDPKGQKTVEYTLDVATTYLHGHHELTLPAMKANIPATVTVRAEDAGDVLRIDGVEVKSGEMRRLSASLRVEIVPAAPPTIGGTFASVGFAKGRALIRTSLEAAQRLSVTPKNAHVVLVLDGSRSLKPGERTAQITAARAYLAHLPDAKVQVLVFDRAVRPLHETFVTAKQADDDLQKLIWSPRNGSALELALSEAARRVALAPKDAPRRIVALTDLRTPSALIPAQVKGLDGAKAVIHLARVEEGAPALVRDDADPWALIPRATGGVLWDAKAGTSPSAARAVYEEWVRPLRIDRLVVSGVSYPSDVEPPSSLAEGEGFADLRLTTFATPSIDVKGELWSTKTSVVLTSSPAEEKRWSALAFGTDVRDELKESEMMTLAKKGGAVSPVTSYLAIEPGVRPSTEGLEWGEGIGFGGLGLIGTGGGGGGGGYGKSPKPDRAGWLREKLAELHKTCGAVGKTHAVFETTFAEIVALGVASADGKLTSAAQRCIEEGAWALELPTVFDESFAKWEVDF